MSRWVQNNGMKLAPNGMENRTDCNSLTNNRLRDCSGNWEHFNLIFPDYLKLMTGIPIFRSEDVGADLPH